MPKYTKNYFILVIEKDGTDVVTQVVNAKGYTDFMDFEEAHERARRLAHLSITHVYFVSKVLEKYYSESIVRTEKLISEEDKE